MIIKTVFVAKIVDEEIVDDVECEVITMAQVSYQNASDGNSISESYTVLYCLNPETGEVSAPRIEHVTIKSYLNENKELVIISGAKKRI